MTLLAYVSSEERLYWRFDPSGSYRFSDAVSGPWGKGKAPPGVYIIHRALAITPGGKNAAFTDPKGLAWFARLIPLFETERSGFGIHPDGNVPGTLGCVGVRGDTGDLFDYLSEPLADARLLVV